MTFPQCNSDRLFYKTLQVAQANEADQQELLRSWLDLAQNSSSSYLLDAFPLYRGNPFSNLTQSDPTCNPWTLMWLTWPPQVLLSALESLSESKKLDLGPCPNFAGNMNWLNVPDPKEQFKSALPSERLRNSVLAYMYYRNAVVQGSEVNFWELWVYRNQSMKNIYGSCPNYFKSPNQKWGFENSENQVFSEEQNEKLFKILAPQGLLPVGYHRHLFNFINTGLECSDRCFDWQGQLNRMLCYLQGYAQKTYKENLLNDENHLLIQMLKNDHQFQSNRSLSIEEIEKIILDITLKQVPSSNKNKLRL